ncbi:MAG: dTDP-4-dehydrorhamnose 3,5-epimerase [Bacteroidota bacterium]|nr:dTDP-4-dehydrorhamnose 3,5-epimerase [Bacteroidota bacterium]
MNIKETPLKDAYIIEPRVFEDERGYFFESYNENNLKNTPLEEYNWVQENESQSVKGVLRGLHFQKGPYSQAKWVRVIEGEVFDVAVDLRRSSPTFGQSFGLVLSGLDKNQFLIPRGFAHGFLVLSEKATFSYKCDNFYSPEHDSGIIYNDDSLNINWPEINSEIILSNKDAQLSTFKDAFKF